MRFEGLADSKDPDTLAVSRRARHLTRMNDPTTGLGSALGRATMPRTGLFCSALFALLPAPAAVRPDRTPLQRWHQRGGVRRGLGDPTVPRLRSPPHPIHRGERRDLKAGSEFASTPRAVYVHTELCRTIRTVRFLPPDGDWYER